MPYHLITNAANLVDVVELGEFPTQRAAYAAMLQLADILLPTIGSVENIAQSIRMIDSDGNELVEYIIDR